MLSNHEGVVAIESLPHSGTAFSIYLPLIDGKALPSLDHKPSTLSVSGQERILLVDDDRTLLGLWLR